MSSNTKVSLSSVITVGGLKHENNTLGIRWYLVRLLYYY